MNYAVIYIIYVNSKICMYNNGIASNSITDNFTKIHEHKIKYIMTLNNLTIDNRV